MAGVTMEIVISEVPSKTSDVVINTLTLTALLLLNFQNYRGYFKGNQREVLFHGKLLPRFLHRNAAFDFYCPLRLVYEEDKVLRMRELKVMT